ncbi:uncharacterized protein [Gossypium hirsutum]|uniref:BED-type domain-containing protein n=1 Tax=Gossypium hirsutum TaxID=3635 RepID=A0ABM3BWA6_GOSHI|nr:uncharacterized protein LOC121230502 [Gossypium hirsutum]
MGRASVFNFTPFFFHFHFVISCFYLPPFFPISKTQIPSSHRLHRSTDPIVCQPPPASLKLSSAYSFLLLHLQSRSSSFAISVLPKVWSLLRLPTLLAVAVENCCLTLSQKVSSSRSFFFTAASSSCSSNSPIPVDDGFNKYESAPKRQKSTTSKVWGEMTKLECEDKNKLKAQCNHCKTIFSAKPSSGTSHLRRHLNRCLKKANKDITQYTIATQPSLGGVPFIKNYKFDADKCRQAISTFLVYGKHSFRTVEESGFRYMMRIASPNFKNISIYTATRDVLMYYAK